MPRPKTKGCQTDYDAWIEHQIQEGIEKLSIKFQSQFEDQLNNLKSDIENLQSTVNEDLTQYRSQLFYEARKIRKKGHLFGTWTQHGNVMVKVKSDDSPRFVSNHNDLKTLIQIYSDAEDDSDSESM